MLGFFRRRDSDQQLEAELRFHFESLVRDYVASGMTEEQARHEARLEVGGLDQLKDDCRDVRPLAWLGDFLQDVRFGLRSLSRNPLLAAAVVIALTFGIGVNSTVFTLVNSEALRARVDKDPSAFFAVNIRDFRGRVYGLTPTAYRAAHTTIANLADLGAYNQVTRVWVGQPDPEPVGAVLVSCNFFAIYGLDKPLLGRLFFANECAPPDGAPVAMIGERLWRDRFASDPRILGRQVIINRQPFTVVGIVPLLSATGLSFGTEIWAPYTARPMLDDARDRFRVAEEDAWLTAVGRLAPGHTRSEVQAVLRVLVARQQPPGVTLALDVNNGGMLARADPRIYWTIAAVVGCGLLVLLAVCVNVSMLLLARADARRREVAIRLSLGAGRARLLRMLLTESLLLSGLAGLISLWMAHALPVRIFELLTGRLPNHTVVPDWTAFAWLAAVTILTGCVAGIAPAAESLKVNLAASMKGGGWLGTAVAASRTRSLLVAAQAALGLVIVVLAGMVVAGSLRIIGLDRQIDVRHLMVGFIPMDERPGARALIAERLRAVPGIASLCWATDVRQRGLKNAKPAGESNSSGVPVSWRSVSPEYFETLGIPIVQGRTFLASETNTSAIVSARLARALWPDRHPLGQMVQLGDDRPAQVVGVAADLEEGFFNASGLQFYSALPSDAAGALVARFQGDSGPVARAIRALGREIESDKALTVYTFQQYYDRQTAGSIALARIILSLGLFTLLLSILGLYGVVSFAVSRRTRELGIRTACGATRVDLFRLVITFGARPVFAGLVLGLGLAFAASIVLAQSLRGSPQPIDPTDPVIYAGAICVLLASAFLATLGPARRAAQSDPIQALRQE